jgi:hypothetical protein
VLQLGAELTEVLTSSGRHVLGFGGIYADFCLQEYSMKRIFHSLLFLTFLIPFSIKAQSDERGYSEELVYGINFNTNAGMIGGGMLRFSRAKGPKQYEGLYFELVNVKDSKEYKVRTVDSKAFIPYKTHYLIAFRPSYVREFVLFRKAAEEGIFVNLLTGIGPSIGMRKSYFVYYDESGNGDLVSRPYEQGMDITRISQNGLFSDGLGSMKYAAGIHGRLALSLEFGQLKSSVAGLEIGFLAEKFAEKQQIMAYKPNDSFFTSAYITLYFGRKY